MSSGLTLPVPHLITLVTLLPLAGVLILLLGPRNRPGFARGVATVVSALCLALSLDIYLLYTRQHIAGYLREQVVPWIPALGISYSVGIDGLSAVMLLLTGILGLAAVLVSYNIKHRHREYFALTLASLSGVFGIFVSLDMFFFILFYELASIPMYFLIGIWGSDKMGAGRQVSRHDAATKLILYLQLGGGLILLGVLAVYFISGLKTFDLVTLMGANLPHLAQLIIFPILFIGFGIEAGFFPFHTWLPDGHSAAPTALSMLLAGVLLKMGGYGILRIAVGLAPDGAQTWMPLFAILAVINVLYGALCALAQTDLKYIIAYSSISHMGIVILGIGAMNQLGFNGAMFQMFSHGIITALLFALAGYIYEKTHTRVMLDHGGLGIRMPYLATVFVLGGLASLGLPGMSGFVAELLVFLGAWQVWWYLAVLAILGLVITATYILRMAQKVFFGPLNPAYEQIGDAIGVERIPLALLSGVMILFGIWPRLLIDTMAPSIMAFLTQIGGNLH